MEKDTPLTSEIKKMDGEDMERMCDLLRLPTCGMDDELRERLLKFTTQK